MLPTSTRRAPRTRTAGGAQTRRRRSAPAPHTDAPPRVSIRLLDHGDADTVDRVFAGLSPRSRYQRFHGAKPRLTEADRRQLAAADGHEHIALVARGVDGEPLGIARCIRLPDDRTTADVAVEVVDDWQRRGIGGVLLAQLGRHAAAAGIERLTATVLTETGLHRALARRGWRRADFDGPALTLEAAAWTVADPGR